MATIYHDSYAPATYTLTLVIDKNGGDTAPSGGSASKSSNAASVTVSKAVPSTLPTWTGHTFLGYAVRSASNAVSVQPGDTQSSSFSRTVSSYTITGTWTDDDGNTHIARSFTTNNQSASIGLFAKWALQTFTVTYNANGGSGAPASQTKTYGTDLTLSAAVPTRDNYIFQGWATSSTGAVEYQAGGTYSTEANVTLYAIWAVAAATLTSVSNVNIGSSGTAAWTKVNESHTYKLVFSLSGAPDYTINNIVAGTASQSFTIPTSWYNALPNSTSATATAVLYTYNGSTLVGSTQKTFKVYVKSSIKPTVSSFTATPHSSNATAEGWGVVVQGYSHITLEVSATAGTGASITGISITGHGINQSSTATSGDTAIVTDTGTLTYTVTVTDSRGRTATYTKTITSYAYSNPEVSSLEAVRCLSDGTASDIEGNYIKAKPVFVFSSVNGNNSLTVKKIEYKLHSASSWTTATSSAISGSWTSPFGTADITKTYDVRCTVTDALNNTFVLSVTVPPVVGFALGLNNDRARFGGPVEKAGLQVDWDSEFNGFVDRTQWRCEAITPANGWHRVLTFNGTSNAQAQGDTGMIIAFHITKWKSNLSEAHDIMFVAKANAYGEFVCEKSVSASLGIDKIRLNRNGYDFYIDLHMIEPTSTTFYVRVDFEVYCYSSRAKAVTANSFELVADAPADETIGLEYTFSADGFHPNQDVTFDDAAVFNGTVSGYGIPDFLFGHGTAIASNSSCDNLTTEGKYTCLNAATAATLTNPPFTNSGFGLWVLRVANAAKYVQIAMPNNTVPYALARYYNGSTWTEWHKYDPIVESGATDGWTYVKYGSGRCHLHKNDTAVTVSGSTKTGSVYYSDYVNETLPFAVTDYDSTAVVHVTSRGYYGWPVNVQMTSSTNVQFAMMRGTAWGGQTLNNVYISVDGKWK